MIQSIHCKTIFVSSITVNDWCQISQSIDVRCPSRLMSDVPVDWCQISQSIDVRYPSRLMSDIPVDWCQISQSYSLKFILPKSLCPCFVFLLCLNSFCVFESEPSVCFVVPLCLCCCFFALGPSEWKIIQTICMVVLQDNPFC
jgi:hypothetical protein